MHWSERIAGDIISRNPDKSEYVCAAGISPSGSVHIGNFRDVATSYFVAKALRKAGKRARFLFSWDEFDRMRKVPINVAQVRDGMDKYIGFPYADMPNPFGGEAESYAKYFENEFEASIKHFGIDMDYRYQAYMYRTGKYTDYILLALSKRGEIFDILDSFRTQDSKPGEREAYYPVSIYCPSCGRDTTKIVSYDDENALARYECECGHAGEFNFRNDFNCKLSWKVDWAMRWAYEGVDFEPGGKDHAAPTGSYKTSKIISKKIFGYEPPIFQGYEFIGIRGSTGKMSGSTGLNLTPETLLKLYQPEIILWLYSKTEPNRAFDFCFDEGILKQYFEFDRMYADYINGRADEAASAVMFNCVIEGRRLDTVPMGLLVQLGSVVDFNPAMLETVFEKLGTPYKEAEFEDRLDRARFWLEKCSPENVNRLRANRNWEVYEALSDDEKKEISELHAYLSGGGYTLDELNTALYAIPQSARGAEFDDKAKKELQGAFFKNVYRLLIDKEKGPRLYLFLFAIEKKRYLGLLDFSAPKRADEEEKPQESVELESAQAGSGACEPDPVLPVKPEIDIDFFGKMDLRVCEIIKCREIRKSQNCYKLTLDDGAGERVIVSSIKHDYSAEELIGKKIIVVANLKPARITGVTSQGMLLAATNGACGCKVIFVDAAVPNGTMIK